MADVVIQIQTPRGQQMFPHPVRRLRQARLRGPVTPLAQPNFDPLPGTVQAGVKRAREDGRDLFEPLPKMGMLGSMTDASFNVGR